MNNEYDRLIAQLTEQGIAITDDVKAAVNAYCISVSIYLLSKGQTQ